MPGPVEKVAQTEGLVFAHLPLGGSMYFACNGHFLFSQGDCTGNLFAVAKQCGIVVKNFD